MSAHRNSERPSEGGLLLSTVPTLVQGMGGDADSVLRRSGLRSTLFTDPPEMLTPEDYFALWSAMEDEVESVGNGPLPLRLVELVSVEYFDPMVFAFLIARMSRRASFATPNTQKRHRLLDCAWSRSQPESASSTGGPHHSPRHPWCPWPGRCTGFG